jgi:hypothetical protein
MNKQIVVNCMMLLVPVFAATLTSASAQEKPGLEGVWFAIITPANCDTHLPLPSTVPPGPFRGLNMFSHDGSMTNEAAFFMQGIARRSGGLGSWRHTQGQNYTATFRFFRYKDDGTFLSIRRVTLKTIALSGDQFISFDEFQDFDDFDRPQQPIPGGQPTSGCNIENATRVQ